VPIFTLIAGPNGVGKSSFTKGVNLEGVERLLDPDAIARQLNLADPSAAAIAAGRETLRRAEQYLNSAVSFVIETTLSGRHHLDMIRDAKSRGFRIHLVFIGLDSPERCIDRVKSRAVLGGHGVPEKDVRRRYARSLENCIAALGMADVTEVYDNSAAGHRLILIWQAGVLEWQANKLPDWVQPLLR
jgi:predicted ABC-type ATPase